MSVPTDPPASSRRRQAPLELPDLMYSGRPRFVENSAGQLVDTEARRIVAGVVVSRRGMTRAEHEAAVVRANQAIRAAVEAARRENEDEQ